MKESRLEEWSRFYAADQPIEIASIVSLSRQLFIPLPLGERGRVRGGSFGICGELSSHLAFDEPFEQREPEEKMEPRNLKDLP